MLHNITTAGNQLADHNTTPQRACLTSDKCRHVKIMYVAHAAANCLLTCKSPPQCECVERAITRRYSELLWVIRFKMCSTLMIWFKDGHEGSYHKQFWKFHQEQSWEAHLQAINRPKVHHPRRPSAIWNTCQNSFFHLTQLEYAKYIVTSNTSRIWAVHTLEIHPNQISFIFPPFTCLFHTFFPALQMHSAMPICASPARWSLHMLWKQAHNGISQSNISPHECIETPKIHHEHEFHALTVCLDLWR